MEAKNMAENFKTILHSEISALAASKLGGNNTAESVSNVVNEYSKSMVELMVEHAPKSSKEKLNVQTPFGALQVAYKDSGSIKNADGTTTKFGGNCTIRYAPTKSMLKALNTEAINEIAKSGAKLAGKIADVVKSVKAA